MVDFSQPENLKFKITHPSLANWTKKYLNRPFLMSLGQLSMLYPLLHFTRKTLSLAQKTGLKRARDRVLHVK